MSQMSCNNKKDAHETPVDSHWGGHWVYAGLKGDWCSLCGEGHHLGSNPKMELGQHN